MTEEEQRLRDEFAQAERELEPIQAELASLDAKLERLEEKRTEYEPLEEACQALEKLEEAGLSRTFWGDRATDAEVGRHLTEVREQIGSLAGERVEVEGLRTATDQRMRQQLTLDRSRAAGGG